MCALFTDDSTGNRCHSPIDMTPSAMPLFDDVTKKAIWNRVTPVGECEHVYGEYEKLSIPLFYNFGA